MKVITLISGYTPFYVVCIDSGAAAEIFAGSTTWNANQWESDYQFDFWLRNVGSNSRSLTATYRIFHIKNIYS